MNTLKAIVDKYDGDFIVLRIGDQELRWPKNKIVKKLNPGQEIHLSLKTTDEAKADKESLAKSILNEILKDREVESK
ncbi:hypothetical protein KKG41_02990 [Patescibacteria group bacterium]|nr:hypothetical protein [Patescibacteria group bacterium]MBU1891117.1 hypothetical protein [Patescibacteria group bacterium]